MDSIINLIIGVVASTLEYLYEIIITVILEAIVNFLADVIDYFRQLHLNRQKQMAFMMDTSSPETEQFASLIPEELKGKGVFEGVFNKDTEKIESLRYVGGKGVDEKTSELLKENPVVVFA